MEKVQKYLPDYMVMFQIGSGTSCQVFLAQNKANNIPVAIKVRFIESIDDNFDLQKMKEEAHFLKKIHHDNIIHFYELIEKDGFIALVLEYLGNGTLMDHIAYGRPMNLLQARKIFIQIAQAIKYLHQEVNIVHRDLKAENILLDNNFNPKLIDFGLSKEFKTNNENDLMRTRCGSPCYVSPEVIQTNGYTEKTDIWSLGIILYLMVYGTFPFYEENIQLLFKKIIYDPIVFPDDKPLENNAVNFGESKNDDMNEKFGCSYNPGAFHDHEEANESNQINNQGNHSKSYGTPTEAIMDSIVNDSYNFYPDNGNNLLESSNRNRSGQAQSHVGSTHNAEAMQSVKDLITQMLSKDPNDRPDIDTVCKHKWVVGPSSSSSSLSPISGTIHSHFCDLKQNHSMIPVSRTPPSIHAPVNIPYNGNIPRLIPSGHRIAPSFSIQLNTDLTNNYNQQSCNSSDNDSNIPNTNILSHFTKKYIPSSLTFQKMKTKMRIGKSTLKSHLIKSITPPKPIHMNIGRTNVVHPSISGH
ncbi:hypothetical protein TRFO_24021 [Tritrichomonas foetus]|uniref:Protein kinase domain-containing protein n=1 Tax=Tritrichomonas foetus TaxID=1144522 RepID=A0A1J4KDZ6_9EUKA|nr:hypothetical protein TRFO_24021 [Tritrichomonas foetus]|eukprot:OHT07685.1 hypothetical protein TRFO_24021 [Tritrichomonas foetus]